MHSTAENSSTAACTAAPKSSMYRSGLRCELPRMTASCHPLSSSLIRCTSDGQEARHHHPSSTQFQRASSMSGPQVCSRRLGGLTTSGAITLMLLTSCLM